MTFQQQCIFIAFAIPFLAYFVSISLKWQLYAARLYPLRVHESNANLRTYYSLMAWSVFSLVLLSITQLLRKSISLFSLHLTLTFFLLRLPHFLVLRRSLSLLHLPFALSHASACLFTSHWWWPVLLFLCFFYFYKRIQVWHYDGASGVRRPVPPALRKASIP